MSKEIIEGNKLIAEFDGWQYQPLPSGYDEEPTSEYATYKKDNRETHFKWIKYHSSWDWLMPVVEKISTIHYGWENKEDEFDDCAYTRTFGMRDKDGNYMIRINAQPVFIEPTLIEATWLAVCWFIKNNSGGEKDKNKSNE